MKRPVRGRAAYTKVLLLLAMALVAPTTFFVSPDTHFTKCGGAPSTLENLHGVADMNALPGTVYPTASKWKGSVASAISGVVIPGDLVDDVCSQPAR